MNEAILEPTLSPRTLFRLGFAAQLVAVVTASAMAYLSLLPAYVDAFPNSDKLAHFVMIGGLAFFLDGAIDRRPLFARSFVPLAPIVVLAVAGLDEYLQRLSPVRDSSWGDFAADVLGVVALTALSRRIGRHFEKGASP